MSFRALRASKTDQGVSVALTHLEPNDLMAGDVTIAVEWSTVNYKDGLALAGQRIIQTFPLTPGIDLAGTVTDSSDARYAVGDKVLVNGWGLSQTHDGGYAELARVPGDWVVPVPAASSTRDAMAIGTAGYTAMLAILALEHAGVAPGQGDVLVTGANGGVGSIAIALLSGLGHRVVASTGRREEEAYLKALGASEIIDRAELSAPGGMIQKERWAGAVDSVGSHTLANVLAQTRYRGAVAACGLAQGIDLPASVAPFILRNITLAGIDSVNAPQAARLEAWRRLASDLDVGKLASTVTEIGLAAVPDAAAAILAGRIRGRTLVNVKA
ncbi:MDR family oxidoreductase [uncultured Phenylobacterium sp.]|uniref:acrylyl-CoA reductase (NADPH) n=1 Tax=uncultured Phenylobacterium sp. TaxID=349273 RepID=UPI0025EE78AD|nr:MDR family oxidoreductase [uncultured Phenylobacterium sp.]